MYSWPVINASTVAAASLIVTLSRSPESCSGLRNIVLER
jgi:hypothetical protein